MPPLPNLIAIIVMVLVVGYFLRGPVLGFIASWRGVEAEAVVKSAELTSVMDERKRYYHRLVLDVAPLDSAPFEATVSQVLPWMSGVPSAGLRVKVRYLRAMKSAVHVVGPVGR
jgi:hypothetical protein